MKKIQAFRIKLVDDDGNVILEKWPCSIDAVVGCLHLVGTALDLIVTLEEGEYQVSQ